MSPFFLTVPFSAPLWSVVQRISATEILLKWDPLSLEESQGFTANYIIRMATSIYACSLTGNVINTETHMEDSVLTGLSPKSEYCVSVAASTAEGVGVFSQWMLVEGGKIIVCLFVITIHAFSFSLRQENSLLFHRWNSQL